MSQPTARLHTGRMLLAPQRPDAAVDPAALRQQLVCAGLIGPALAPPASGYAAGEHFLDLIGFTGCAVQLELTPGAGPFLHLRIDGPYPAPVLRHGRNTRPPRCPGCGRPLADWRQHLGPDPADATTPLHCHDCRTVSTAGHWNWRQHAGSGRLFLCIEEVFPGEGQPLPALLRTLDGLGAGPWLHFYVQD